MKFRSETSAVWPSAALSALRSPLLHARFARLRQFFLHGVRIHKAHVGRVARALRDQPQVIDAPIRRHNGGRLKPRVHGLDEQMRGVARCAGFHHPARRIAHDDLIDLLSGLELHVADLHGACDDGRQARPVDVDEFPGLRQHGRGAAPGPVPREIESAALLRRQRHGIRPQKVVEKARRQRRVPAGSGQGRSRQSAQQKRGDKSFHPSSPVAADALP